ncbi:uncharacterized protein LOC105215036 [Zeugodacus cucurbitae]|uniref:Lysostaphin resistance protein A n=1 Tax=Zeugodacus cucurbitae TaxID=28588 RepID=A0A0A1X1B2_ZEUCU|nr:uncharacterized protein LOC105215036 [Zeugodacus cucurbitae]XP_054086426.1 uncharacterized protein LOC105215036 [Zeugodacus cucurbitae]XP_054086427.1 uncharacterized protein LOC105215036 [Zeugodacus cucurbitae]XP_054086428.1 uncharacterized protein LOC105215036 [Zeugodacus cucurbitae]XP_054086430.1 uncharacterized protein LOC105215036 [Zeugodacus cucurbitae]
MTSVTTMPNYNRQQSADSGWDNPFRPGGDLSREADEIVNMIRGGKPITPTEEDIVRNGEPKHEDDRSNTVIEAVSDQIKVTQNQAAQNGTKSSSVQAAVAVKPSIPTDSNGTSSTQVSKKVVPGPSSASHIIIDEKKNTKKGCCSIQ